MAKTVKISSQLSGVHNLVAQGSIPHPTTAGFLNLHIRQKAKERLLTEQERLKKRNQQIESQLKIIDHEIKRLLELSTGGEWIMDRANPTFFDAESLNKTLLKKNRTAIGY